MPLSSTLSPMPAVAFDRPMTLPLFAPLAARLDAALIVTPVVTAITLDPVVEALEPCLGLSSAGLVSRRVRVADGRRLTVVGVPGGVWSDTAKTALLTLKAAAARVGRRVLLVPEGALDREPRMSDALLVAGCAGLAVAPADRLSLGAALIEAGGSLPLADAAERMARANDPVAAVLSLVAGRIVGLDLGRPLGPESLVLALEGRTLLPAREPLMAACSRIPFVAGPFETEILDRLCGSAGPGVSTSAGDPTAEPVDTDLPDLDLAALDLPDFGRPDTPSAPRGRVVGRRRVSDAAGGDVATWRRAPLQVAAALLFARALDAVPGLAAALRTGTPRVIVEVTDPLLLGVLRGIWPVLLFGEHGISESIDRALTPREAERADILTLVATELPKPRERDEVERTFLQVLQVPRPVLCLTVDAERALLPIVRQVADHSLVLPGLDPTLVAATIRVVTGRWGKRADRAALATLDLMPADLAIAIRADRTPAACLCDLRRLAASRANRSGSGRDLRLADLHGMRPAVAWARETLNDLRAWRAGGPWGEVSSGALIVGPPGCGKTLLAAVMAAEEGLPFVTGSLARWQAEDQAHLGTTLRAMRRCFEEAITLARSGPGGHRGAILLIDEADSFPDRSRVTHTHRDYVVEVVNAILELLSGAASREGVVVIGTTNDATRCDPAMLRPGRLSRLIEVGYPDLDERVAMLRVRLRGDLREADLAPVARLTERATGAVIEEVVADARRLAREAGRPLALADLLSVVGRAGAGRPPALLRRAAIHEAGHALVAALERGTEHLVVALQDRDGAAGWVDYAGESSRAGTRSEIEGMLRILLAGRAAEIEMLGEPSAGARGDLTAATNLAVAALGCWGLGSSTLVALDQDPAQRLLLDGRLHAEVAVLLDAIAEEAGDLVYQNSSTVMRIAEALLTERRLDGARVAELLHEPGGIATGEGIAARGAA